MYRHIQNKLMVFFLIILIVVPVSSATAAALTPYKIGLISSQSGTFAAMIKPVMEGFLLAIEDVNKRGGINGHPIEVISYDDESDEIKVVLLIKKLAETDKVIAIAGPFYTGGALALSPVANELKIPVTVGGGSSAIDAKLGKWAFRTVGSERDEVKPVFEVFKKAGVTKMAVLLQGGGYGLGSWNAIKDEINKYGFELSRKETYDPKGVDFTPQLTKIKVSDSNGMLVFGAEIAGALAVKQARLIGIKWPIAIPAPMGSPDIVKAVAEFYESDVYLSDFALSVWNQLPDTYQFKKPCQVLDELVRKKHNRPATSWDGDGARHATLLEDVLKRAAVDADPARVKNDRSKVRNAMENTKGLVTASGTVAFSPTVHSGLYPGARIAVMFKGGKRIVAGVPE